MSAAQTAGVLDLKVSEQDSILYLFGNAAKSAAAEAVWNALRIVDPNYSTSDINVNVQTEGLAVGASLIVARDSSKLNIRQEASTDRAIIAKAAKGETLTLVEQTCDEWWKVKTADGQQGQVCTRYLQA
ncbi:MAG: SH3 domain-containing protein [Chryseobacterium sp.]|nr:SH3 domain-containing protein [Chryseobacterium sp.]